VNIFAEVLWANIDRKSAVLKGWFGFGPNFEVEGIVHHQPFCMARQASECLKTLSLMIFTQRNFVADFLRESCTFSRKTVTYAVHLRLIGKPICDFLLANNTNYCAISHCFQVTADYWSNFRSRQGVATRFTSTPWLGWTLRISG